RHEGSASPLPDTRHNKDSSDFCAKPVWNTTQVISSVKRILFGMFLMDVMQQRFKVFKVITIQFLEQPVHHPCARKIKNYRDDREQKNRLRLTQYSEYVNGSLFEQPKKDSECKVDGVKNGITSPVKTQVR